MKTRKLGVYGDRYDCKAEGICFKYDGGAGTITFEIASTDIDEINEKLYLLESEIYDEFYAGTDTTVDRIVIDKLSKDKKSDDEMDDDYWEQMVKFHEIEIKSSTPKKVCDSALEKYEVDIQGCYDSIFNGVYEILVIKENNCNELWFRKQGYSKMELIDSFSIDDPIDECLENTLIVFDPENDYAELV